jgi:HEAT repeat protein
MFLFQVLICASATASGPNTGPNGAAEASRSATNSGRAVVDFKDERLSVSVTNQPLTQVLNVISQKAMVAITAGGDLGREERVTIKFQGLSLEDGLRRVLANYDAFFFYGGDARASGQTALKGVWVYPKGRGNGLEPVAAEEWASTREYRGKLSASDPMVRADAIKTVVEREGDRARPAVLKALKDSDPQVRSTALDAALNAHVQISPDRLRDLANDSSPDVRVLALGGLASAPDAREIATQASNDPDPHVRALAGEILGRLKASEAPPSPRQLNPPVAHH